MPSFSSFTPFGALAFSGHRSEVEIIYRAMVASYGGQYDMTPGTHLEACVYARARGIARGRLALRRAFNQRDPLRAIEMLPQLERDYGVVPGEFDSIYARQQHVASVLALTLGGNRTAMETGLRRILGADFLSLRALVNGTEGSWTIGPSNYARPELPARLARLTDPVAVTGVPMTVAYAPMSEPVLLVPGDVVTVQGETQALVEVVTLSAATTTTLTATFGKAHDVGATLNTGSYPNWQSTQSTLLVVVSTAASRNAEKRRRVDEFMAVAAKGVTQWSIVGPAATGFVVGTSVLGTMPLGTMTY